MRRDARVIGVVGVAHGLSHFFQLVLPPLFPLLRAEFGVSYATLGALVSVFYVASGVCQFGAGFAVDRFGARPVLFGGLALLTGGALLAGFVPGVAWLFPLAMLMGLGGSFYAHYVKFISPDTFNPLMGTFLVWVMLMAGGSGNNRGAMVGAAVIWGLWSFSDVLTDKLPSPLDTRASYVRVMLIGFVLQGILLKRPQGIIPEK